MKTKTKIIRAFLEYNKPMTIREISRTIKSDYRITHTATQRLLTEGALVAHKVGPALLCNLQFSYYGMEIILAENARTKKILKNKNINQLRADIIGKLPTSLYILILNKGLVQDINLLFISNEPTFPLQVQQVIDSIPLQINFSILSEKQFKQREFDPTKNIVLHNLDSYYLLKGQLNPRIG